jgi:hypothetical protein
MSTFQQKLKISAGSALLFALMNLPQTYKFIDSIIPGISLFNAATNCPTNLGLLAITVLFFLVTFLSMRGAYVPSGIKLKHSIYGSLIFFFISSPVMYSFVSNLLGRQFASAAGCPSLAGVALHALVYCAALVGVMYLP